MIRKLHRVENQLKSCIASSLLRHLLRSEYQNHILLSTNSDCRLSVCITADCIKIGISYLNDNFVFPDEPISQDNLESVGCFINELLTGSVISERIYYGNSLAKHRITLVNQITKHNFPLCEEIISPRPSVRTPRLVLRKKLFMC